MKRTSFDKLPGVYFREHPTNRHNGKPDRCFDIAYRTQGGRQGKLVWEKVGWASEGYTAQMASQVRAERIRTVRHGEELPNKKADTLTFGDLWKEYAKWAEGNRKSFKAETSRYGLHIKPVLEKTPVTELNPFQLEKLKSDLQKKGLSPQTVKHVLVLIRQTLNKGSTFGLWKGENPVKQVKMPRPNNARTAFLTKGQAASLLDELAKVSPQLREMALLALHTGMRAGEIFALKWSHINLAEGIINVSDPKGGQAQSVYITPTTKAMLSSKVDQAQGDWVFKSRSGGQVKEVSDAFERAVDRLGFNAGIEDRRQKVCFHTLRHTFASWLAIAGVPILTIKNLMRHSSLAMTERYAKLNPNHERDAISVIETTQHRGQSEPGSPSPTSQGLQESNG